MKTEVILNALGYFVETTRFSATFTESRPVSLGQLGVEQFTLSREPSLNDTPGTWSLTASTAGVSMTRLAEAHRYCSEQWGGDFEAYKNIGKKLEPFKVDGD